MYLFSCRARLIQVLNRQLRFFDVSSTVPSASHEQRLEYICTRIPTAKPFTSWDQLIINYKN